jgi:hypothetical protein
VPRRAGVLVDTTVAAQFNGAGTSYTIRTPGGVWYLVYVNVASDVVFCKSDDNGISWSDPVTVFTGTVTALAIWYDRWTGIAAGLIHCAYQESATDDTLYRTINTESSDALSTQTTIFLGASTAGGGHLSITRAVGGNVYCKTVIDAGTEGGFFRLPNANVPNGAWDAARTVDEAIATTDQMILLPDLTAADTQDCMAIFWDASANEISRKLYDDSGNSWAETSIATSMTDSVATTAFPHFDAATDLTNSQIVLVAWSNVDTASSRLRAWTVTASAITALTDVVSSSTDDQGMAAIAINEDNANNWWVFYGGKTDGSETFQSALNIWCKGTMDAGSTWGPETQITGSVKNLRQILASPRAPDGRWGVMYYSDITVDQIIFIATLSQPETIYVAGVV